MFKSFEVERFRGLTRCQVNDMRRVTLLTGRNNAGKTALLEAMFIHTGRQNPNLVMVTNAIRGVAKVEINGSDNSDAPWQSIFSSYDDTQSIRLIGDIARKSGHSDQTTVIISTVRGGAETSGLNPELRRYNLQDVGEGPTRILKVEVTVGRRTKSTRHFLILGNKKRIVTPPPSPVDIESRFISAYQRDSAEVLASQFSRFQAEGKVDLLVEALKAMEPRLQELTLMYVAEPMLHGNIGLKSRRFIPLAMMGDGLNRVAALVLAIGSTRDGVVLVDDIDTGLHHSVMESFWATIFRAAELFNVQVVATTHSDECAKAALESSLKSNNPNDMCLVRLERREDGVAAFTYSASELKVAFEADLEVR